MILILLKQRTFNWSANVPTLVLKSVCATYRETAGNCISLISIVVQYGPCREEEQVHLQSTCLLGHFKCMVSTLLVGLP